MKLKILFGFGPKNHVRLAYDEIEGLENIGYICKSIGYGRNAVSMGAINRLYGVLKNAIILIVTLYRYSPDILYLSSRIERMPCIRDFISILMVRCFYFKKLRIVIKSHGSELSVLSSNSFFFNNLAVPFLIKQVDRWFFLSQDEKACIRDLNADLADNIIVTANIIDPSRSFRSLEFKRRYGIDNGKFNFLYVGRMVKVKGIFSIIKSIPPLDFKDKCNFIFVGDGSDLDELKSLTDKLQISHLVCFMGFVPDAECDLFYSNTDALIYPTFDQEGFPMALFKSVAAGLPIITTQIRAAKDYLKAPDNTLWVNGDCEKSVAEAITEIYKNRSLQNSMSLNNKILGQKFSRSYICSEMSETFKSL